MKTRCSGGKPRFERPTKRLVSEDPEEDRAAPTRPHRSRLPVLVLARLIIAFSAVGLLSVQALAQDWIPGQVADTTGAPIAGATIATSRRSVKTDSFGRFALALAPGEDSITVSAPGFRSKNISLPTAKMELHIVLDLPSFAQQIVVTPAAQQEERAQANATVTILSIQQLAETAAPTLDAKLAQVPGFTLFRRGDSRSVNPTAQGVSLRGVGSSGSSRTLVVEDGMPLNDPFGGWVYFDRIPEAAIDRVEVVQGGASELYGSAAMGGVVDVLLKDAPNTSAIVDLSAGTLGTLQGSSGLTAAFGKWSGWAFVEGFRDDGYFQVDPPLRGSIDRRTDLRYGSALFRVTKMLTTGSLFAALQALDDARSNGTAEQFNNVRLWTLFAGANVALGSSALNARIYGDAQSYNQTFSSIAAGRNSETFLRTQHVPAQQNGGSAQLSVPVRRQWITVGGELSEVRGASEEVAFVRLKPGTASSSGGHQRTFAFFAHDRLPLVPRLQLTMGARVEYWSDFDAVSTIVASAASTPSPQRSDTAVSPRLGLLFAVNDHLHLTASSYRSFRAPTLNELYRGFRLGNIQTNANALLKPEFLTGAEGGADVIFGRAFLRANYFYAQITDPIANLTLATTPASITRVRSNLGKIATSGLELQAEVRLMPQITLSSGLEYAPSRIASFSAAPILVGKQVPEAADAYFNAGITYNSARWSAAAQFRARSGQYDDDLNTLYLSGFTSLDLYLSRKLAKSFEVYGSVENVYDDRYALNLSPVPLLASPRTYRVGLRWSSGR